MYLQKVISQKKFEKNFVGILKDTDEKIKIQSSIRIHMSVVRIRGSDSYQNVTDPQH